MQNTLTKDAAQLPALDDEQTVSKRSYIRFNERLEQVRQFCVKNGHGWIPARYDTEPKTGLGHWANLMRHQIKQGKCDAEKDALIVAGFLLEPPPGPPIRSKKLVKLREKPRNGSGNNAGLSRQSSMDAVRTSVPAVYGDESTDDGLVLVPTPYGEELAQSIRPPAVRPEGYPIATDSLDTLIKDGCRFGAILADPPWRYSNTVSNGAADRHYPTMSMDELRDLPVPQLALPDAYLFLWATAPLLPEALDLMQAWGFDYKTHMVWNKPRFGMGNYWRSAHELLCLGIRGKPAGWCRHDISSWAVFPATRHSAKPSYFRDMIASVVDGPYLEMFGREQNSGWTTFGNQVQPTLFACMNEESLASSPA